MNRLLTPKFEEAIKDYPLYSQDGKERNAVCVAIFTIGNIRWFVLEGGKEGDDTILYCIVVGLGEDEYGYVSLKELADVELDYRKQGFGVIRVIQMPMLETETSPLSISGGIPRAECRSASQPT